MSSKLLPCRASTRPASTRPTRPPRPSPSPNWPVLYFNLALQIQPPSLSLSITKPSVVQTGQSFFLLTQSVHPSRSSSRSRFVLFSLTSCPLLVATMHPLFSINQAVKTWYGIVSLNTYQKQDALCLLSRQNLEMPYQISILTGTGSLISGDIKNQIPLVISK